jgi:hypothetical protein
VEEEEKENERSDENSSGWSHQADSEDVVDSEGRGGSW